MKRFTAFFLSIILCICCLVPVSVRAAEFQAVYTSDLSLGDYKYFFISRSSSGDYLLYCLNDKEGNISEGIQFFVSSDPKKSYFGITGGVVSKYSSVRFTFDSSSSFFKNRYSLGGSISDWDFYNSGSGGVILASNADIYDQDGYKIRSGDYENFLSYFTNPEQVQYVVNNYVPQEPTTTGEGSGESGSSGGFIDFSGLIDSIGDGLNSLSDSFATLLNPIYTELQSIHTYLQTILPTISTRIIVESELIQQIDRTLTQLGTLGTDITSKLNSVSYDIISKLDSIQVNELTSIKNKLEDIKDILNIIKVSFINFTDVGNSSVQTIVDSIETAETTIATDLIQFQAAVTNKFNSVLSVFDTVGGKVFDISSDLLAIKNSLSDLSYQIVFGRLYSLIGDIPSSIQNVLEYLFIPQNDDYFQDIIDTINSKFGFINQFIELGDVLVNNSESFTNTPPNFTIEFEDNDIFGDLSFDLIDWSKVSDYIPYVKALTSGITLYLFIRRTRKKLPEIISGGGC